MCLASTLISPSSPCQVHGSTVASVEAERGALKKKIAAVVLAGAEADNFSPFEAARKEMYDWKGGVYEPVPEPEDLDDDAVMDDERIRQAVRTALRQALKLVRERRPIIEVQITRLGREALQGLLDEAEPAR